MNDPDQTVAWFTGTGNGQAQRNADYDGLAALEDPPAADVAAGLTSVGFIRAALRRSARLLCITAVAGLLIGGALYAKDPPAYKASTTVLLTNSPTEDATDAIDTAMALAESREVAGLVVRQLGLRQSVGSLVAASTVTIVTDRVLNIQVGAPSSADAVRETSALATNFLQFRAAYVRNQQQLLTSKLSQQVSQAQQYLASINQQISQLSAQPSASAQQAELKSLQAQRGYASSQLTATLQNASATLAASRVATAAMVDDSQVLDAATPMAHSKLKSAGFYLVAGLFAGLALGMFIVIIRALVSDRLRRRDDIADAVGAPVGLSVGSLHAGRRLPVPRRRDAATPENDMRRFVALLRSVVPGSSRGVAGLAVVAVDNARVVAPAVVSLAVSCARQGKRVIVADLSVGAPAAGLLGANDPGVSAVTADGADLRVAIPGPDDVAPVGPIQGKTPQIGDARPGEALVAACASADLLLTLVTLDPAVGGDHLATWATDAVTVVTAGQSTATRIHAVGEMIRLAGTRLATVVLIGADKTDESLGALDTPDKLMPTSPI